MQEKDPKLKKELENINSWGEDKTDDEVVEALQVALRRKDISWLSEEINQFVKELEAQPSSIDKKTRTYIAACNKRILNLHKEIVQQICNSLTEASDIIPNNIYGIRDALQHYAWLLEESIDKSLEATKNASKALQIASRDRFSEGDLVFTGRDLKEEYQAGFEKGYQKCLENKERSISVDPRMSHLDIQ